MTKALQNIVKAYPPRGPIQQFRLESTTAFHCFRCGSHKRSNLVTIYYADWEKILCNGCYGRLLSIYEIKKGTSPEDEKADELAKLLLSLVTYDQARVAAEKNRIVKEKRNVLSEQSLRFIGTAEYVANGLNDAKGLDWSPPIICLCKAFEAELVHRVIAKLKELVSSVDLSTDVEDKDLKRVARYCLNLQEKPPEIGAIGYFMQVAVHSKDRINSSNLLLGYKKLLASWPHSDWLIKQNGVVKVISDLTTRFRNKAAHIDDLGEADYEQCRDFLLGSKGQLWELIAATH